jgi:hypothetical protein
MRQQALVVSSREARQKLVWRWKDLLWAQDLVA